MLIHNAGEKMANKSSWHDERGEYPQGLNPAELPTFIALPWREYCREAFGADGHPVLALHRLCDAFEIAIRWAVVLIVSDIMRSNSSRLPKGLVKEIGTRLERPTLAGWRDILLIVSKEKYRPKDGGLLPTAYALLETVIDQNCLGEKAGGTTDNSILVLRQDYCHSGVGIPSEQAKKLLKLHEPRIEQVMRAVSKATDGFAVMAWRGGELYKLHGSLGYPIEIPAGLEKAADSPFLYGQDIVLPLCPLSRFAMIMKYKDSRLQDDGPWPQLYRRFDDPSILFTPLGAGVAVAEEKQRHNEFKELFGMG